MEKVTQFFAILGAFSALCGLIAKALINTNPKIRFLF
jgi:hypothetical protein